MPTSVTLNTDSKIKLGRASALYAQSILLVGSLAGLIYEVGCQPRFPEEPSGWGMALQIMPNVVLVLILAFKIPAAAWVGLVTAFAALVLRLPDVSSHTFGEPLGLLFAALWLVTLAALIGDAFADKATSRKVIHSLVHGKWLKIAARLAIIGAIIYLPIAAVRTALRSRTSEDYVGQAPPANFESRRAWGESELHAYLNAVDKFAPRVKIIRDDIGPVVGIAPIGSPNRTREEGFGDEFPASMNLEVVGKNGSGVLHLPKVYILGREPIRLSEDASWTFEDATHLIEVSGDTYLARLGVAELVAEIHEVTESGQATEVVHRCEALDDALAASGETPRHQIAPDLKLVRMDTQNPTSTVKEYRMEAVTDWKRQPRTFSEFHPLYRIPLLKIYANSLAQTGRTKDALKAWQDAAEFELGQAKDLLREGGIRRAPIQIEDRLKSANESLKLANQLAPQQEKTISLARTRVELSYLHSIDARSFIYSYEDRSRYEAWAIKLLGVFFREAIQDAERFSYLDRIAGHRKVRVDRDGGNDLYVNKNDVYEARVRLEVAGSRAAGTLRTRLSEDPGQCPPLDLFADVPRAPRLPLKDGYYRWSLEGQDHSVVLHSDTGEPVPGRKK